MPPVFPRLRGRVTPPPERSSPDISRLYVIVGGRLRLARELKGITRERLAGELGISLTSLSQIEGGHQHPPLEWFYLAASAIGADVTEILPPIADFVVKDSGILEVIERDRQLTPEARQALRTFFQTTTARR